MLFSQRARVNGPSFLVGWVVALAAVSTMVYVVSHDGNVAQTSSTASDSVSWGTIALGVGLLALGPPQLAEAPGARRRARHAEVAGNGGIRLAGQSPRAGASHSPQ